MYQDHILPYEFIQGWKEPNIEIFMHVCECNLADFLKQNRPERSGVELLLPYTPEDVLQAVKNITRTMFHQILGALAYVHSLKPQIIHRDIKPENILYQSGKFLLTDFGIAKVVDTSTTEIGTRPYRAPEIGLGREQTSKVDIYGLGATLVICLTEFPDEEKGDGCHSYLQELLEKHEPHLVSMLADDPKQRPTASLLLESGHFQAPHTPLPSLRDEDDAQMDWTPTVPTAIFQGSVQQPGNVSTLLSQDQ